MVTVCLTNVTAPILNLMTSQELLSGGQERCCPFLPVPAEVKPLKSRRSQAHDGISKSIGRRALTGRRSSRNGLVFRPVSIEHFFLLFLFFFLDL